MDKNIMIGSGAAVLAIAGLWYAMKQSSSANTNNSGGSTTVGNQPTVDPYASIGASGATSGTTVSTGGATIDTSQVGNLASLLGQQSVIGTINANANYDTGIISTTGMAADPFLSNATAQLENRGSDYLLSTPTLKTATAGGGGSIGALLQGNQRLISGGPQNFNLDYSGTTTNSAPGNSNAGAPSQQTFTAHLNETLPSLAAAPLAGSQLTSVAAPATAVQGAQVNNSKIGGCFITTAICEAENKPDDCEELTILRSFRDGFMQETDERRALVRKYYTMAPIIVRLIHIKSYRKEIYASLRSLYLTPAINAIKGGRNDLALTIYTNMFTHACDVTMIKL